MDKSRQQFEYWYLNNHGHEQKYPLHKDESGEYFYDRAIKAWEAWQASRESLEVELPSDVITGHDGMFDEGLAIGYNNALEECKEMLISNGVKIKNE
ncbi:TPA: hypothetical protein SMP35_002448 [Proteus mirabilis]|uniref:hypothetical protein n=1 Tax=Proteus sp. G2659 TaxID=2698872 RepID=UPI0013769C5E|nr:hypothetical protein [Proteus sp. G2659]NBM79574.1 hypothetical protein [Proteus sp. G2659]HEK0670626.1 hypothetical protein [Proteus mirabilis]